MNEKKATRFHMKTIDLTHLLNEKISVYPDTPGPRFVYLNTVEQHGFAEMKAEMVLHVGTHIDAPCHIIEGGRSLDQFGPDKFMGPAIMIRCDALDEIGIDALSPHEEIIKKVRFILFFTGWQS